MFNIIFLKKLQLVEIKEGGSYFEDSSENKLFRENVLWTIYIISEMEFDDCAKNVDINKFE